MSPPFGDIAKVFRTNLVELLQAWARTRPEQGLYTFLDSAGEETAALSFGGLDRRARAIAAELQAGPAAGERALLLYPPGLDFVAAFFGCLYAEVIAVPAYPPRPSRGQTRLRAIAADSGARIVLTTAALAARMGPLREQIPELAGARWIATDALPPGGEARWREVQPAGDAPAFLQYTSGSTADPKGVIVTHGNLLHNEEMIRRAFAQSEDSVIVGWLPLYHDMGLIGNVLQPLYLGARAVLMSPLTFLQRPAAWLEAISRYGATTSGGPNFAYELCLRKVGAAERKGLDLGSWQVAFNGAEPVRARTLAEFAQAFAPCGFRREAFYPCYGLAEATLFVTGGEAGETPRVAPFSGSALEVNRVAREEEGGGRDLVGCGRTWMGQEVAIVDPESGRRCSQDQVGEIWLAGPSVAGGYWGKPEATAEAFEARIAGEPGAGPFLRTGDLGFVDDGELFVTGRRKDLIVAGGRNLYPQDVEQIAERAHSALRPGCGAAFAVDGEEGERLVVVWELQPRTEGEAETIAAAIRQSVTDELEVAVEDLVFLTAGTILKTSSGKIRRQACRAAYLAGELQVVGRCGAAAVAEPVPFPGREALEALSPGERPAAIAALLRREIARLARVPVSRVVAGEPLTRLGLDSLGAAELQQGIERTLGVTLSLADLLGDLDCAGLAQLLSAALEAPARELPRLTPTSGEAEGPLSPGQQALWLLDRVAGGSGPNQIAAAAAVRPARPGAPGLDGDRLRRALDELARRHPILRATFEERVGEPRQRIHPDLRPGLRVEDASGWSEAELQERSEAEAWRSFDLATGPLLRVAVFQRSQEESRLVLAVHHLIADFWTLALGWRELAALYRGETLPAPAVQYADYVKWQAERLAGPEGERLAAWWRERLAPPLPSLALPADRRRPPVPSYEGGAELLPFSRELSERLGSLAQASGATLFATLLAGYQALLHRYTGQPDLLVSTPVAGRRIPELAGLAGYLVNPVVLATDLHGDPSFGETLEQARRTALSALEHQDYPFLWLAEALEPERDPGRAPLAQTMFVFQRAERPEEEALAGWAVGAAGLELGFGDLVFATVGLPERFSQLDLTLRMARVDGALTASLQYSADLFDPATVHRMLGHLRELLAGAAATPGVALSELPLLTPAERTQLLDEWQPTAGKTPDANLYELFAAQAARTPEAEALIAGDDRLSYRELAARAGDLAAVLRGLGVGPEERVGVCLPRSTALLVSLLGALSSGGAYVPLDPTYPPERLALMLEDSGARVVLTVPELASRLPERPFRVLLDPAGRPTEPLPVREGPAPRPKNLAYLIYTSGSTGRPKAVAITHGNAVALVRWARRVWSDAELSGVLFATSICFDLSVFELFVPLASGGRVIVAEDALALPRLPAAREVTLVNTVPSAMAELLRQRALPASVRTVNLAGEALERPLVDAILGLGTVEAVWNLYGPSEDTTYSTHARQAPGGGAPTIGRPVDGTRAYVLGGGMELLPVGVPGEIWLGGAGLARGYFRQPAQTADRFRPDPWSGRPGERLYRTGDLARRRLDGEIEFLGRLDHQVKVRGFRIELGEIEARLVEHPGVSEAAVAVAGDGLLAAYVGVGREPALTPVELRTFLQERLPGHMVPAVFMLLPALPRNARGKLERSALPSPEGAAEAQTYVAPRSEMESLLAALWQEALAVPRVGVHDDFFRLGGHSLKAARVLAAIRDTWGIDLPVRSLFAAPTIAQQAQVVERDLAGRAGGEAERIARRPATADPAPLSYAQERLWFLDQLLPGTAAYNLPTALRLRGPLRLDLLRRSLQEIVRRHEALRTTFREESGQPVQVVQPADSLDLPVIDLSLLPPEHREAAARRGVDREARLPFRLDRGPLLRAAVFRLSGTEHVLVLNLHHVVADAWSLGVLLRELGTLYGALARGLSSPLPELPIQYADYAIWQREWLQGERLASQLDYWKQQLAGLPTLELSTDHPRPASPSWRGARLPVRLPAPLLSEVQMLCEAQGVTLFTALFAAFSLLLHRYTGQADVASGTVLANRGRSEVLDLIGLFANTLVLRSTLGPGDSRALLRQLQEISLDAQAHQDLPFEKLVEELNPDRSLAHNPLVQMMFSLQNAPLDLAFPGTGLALERLEADSGTARLDLFLLLWEEQGGLAGVLEHSTELFDAASMGRLFRHYEALLSGLAADPGRRPEELPLLFVSERHQLLAEWNDTALPPPSGSVHGEIAAQAARTPDRPALSSDQEISYGELDRRADRLARSLQAQGVGMEDRVGVCLPRSPEMVVALLAVLKAGGAYVPLDPAYPRERLALVADDAGLKAIVADRTDAELFSGLPVPVVRIDAGASADRGTAPASPALPNPLAYLIYTSGSTGTPKGVMVGHANVQNFFAAMDRRLHMAPGRWLAVTSISFDISVLELLWTLARGFTVVLPPSEEDASIPDLVLRHAVSHLQCTPSMATGFASDPAAGAALARLDRLLLGGEALPEPLAGRLADALGGELFNVYGPTETTVWSAAERIGPGARVTLGRPLANTDLHVVDAQLHLAPTGQSGELAIGGAGVVRGYQRRPERTAESFVPDPFSGRPGSRLYRTGDLMRRLPDGRLAFLGRVDHQVKVRGHRIEPGEIEAALVRHPAVREAVVAARPDGAGDLRLVAWVVPAEGKSLEVADLAADLKRRLPPFLCPESWIVLAELPRTPNGKLDRRALPAPEPSRAGRGAAAPHTATEAALAEIWRELLGAGELGILGIEDNFFDLGGNSLKAMQLRSRIRSTLGVDLPLGTLFEAQTIAHQAEQTERAWRASRGGEIPPLRPASTEGPPPLSFSQERLWFLEQLEPGSAVYNLPAAVRMDGELDPSRLERALEKVVERHAVLRTSIRSTPAGPVQVVADRPALSLPRVDLAALPAGGREAEAGHLAATEALFPFDLARGPLLRATLVRLGETRHHLLVTFHHIVTDGWSLGIFFDELARFYASAGDPGLPDLPVQYADFAIWQRRWLQGEELERLLGYWRNRLAGAPAALELPFDRPRPAVQTYRGATQPLTLGGETTHSLRALGRSADATLFMTLLAALGTLLHRYARQHDLVLGTPTANRGQVEVENLVGFFANSLALRLDFGGDPSFRELLGRVRKAVLADYAHQDVPFEKLVEALRPERDLSHNPIYQVVFSLESGERRLALDLPGLRWTALPPAEGTAKFDLALYMEDRAEGLTGLLETNRDLFDRATGTRWLGQLTRLLDAILEDPGRRLSELSLLGPAERHQLLSEANDRPWEPPAELLVHRLFEVRAAAHPSAPALSQEDRRLTYAEANGRANQLARRLRRLGVGPEVRVAICLERSPELIVSLLAVLKAGGAYVPLDPTYPQDRLAFLLADSRASVLVTDETILPRFPETTATPLLVDATWQSLAGEEATDLAPLAGPENLAYVIYTSGSTGKPKGVMIEHRSLASYTATATAAYGAEPDDRVLQFCSISFDISIEEIVPCLTRGAELVLRTEQMIESIATFLATCRERSLSMLSLPTAYWHEITSRVEAGGVELPPSLRLIIIAGERALPERFAAWLRHAPERPRLINTYGLTESTIISTVADLTAWPGSDGTREVPIGRTIPDTEIYLLDARLEPVPLGVPGEIYLGGGLLARGYLHRPDVTAERFVPHFFSREAGARLYRTGDLARRLPGGELEFLGRGDHQVKIRGYRIELGEIETALAEHPAVAGAVATVREDRPGQKRLVAYLTTRPGRPVESLDELRAFLRKRLPDYMLPGTFVFLDAMPLTPNGKVDRAALPAPQVGSLETGEEFVPPGDEMEREIAAIWQEVLGLPRVGVHDNFFDLGGHSLLLIQLQDRFRERFGKSLPIVELFKHPTVGSLARYLGDSPAAPAVPEPGRAAERAQERAARTRASVREERFLKARRKVRE